MEFENVEPFGIWHVADDPDDPDECDFFLFADSGDVSCKDCVKLYTEQQVKEILEQEGDIVVTKNLKGQILFISRQDEEGRILSIISESSVPPQYKHKKSQGVYGKIGHASLQTDVPLMDMADVVVYKGEDGRLWVRPVNEWEERFDQQ